MKFLGYYLINVYFRETVVSRISVRVQFSHWQHQRVSAAQVVQQISCQLLVNVMDALQWYLLAVSEIEGELGFVCLLFI